MSTTQLADPRFLKRLRLLGLIEGTSTLILFGIAMPMKYVWDMPLAVRIVGSVHGFLFVALALVCLIAIERVPIGRKLGLAGILGAVIPFGPFVVDHWLKQLEVEVEVEEVR
jgi:integral membrane protein